MSVIIKGMEMPIGCIYCHRSYWSNIDQVYKCNLTNSKLLKDVMTERNADCPMMEIPKGVRLIDATEIEEKISFGLQEPDYQHEGESWSVGLIMAMDYVEDATVIFEEEPVFFEEGKK